MFEFEVGQKIILNKKYFEHNPFFVQFFPNLKPSVPYEILGVDYVGNNSGITILKNIETGETFDKNLIAELNDYYCFVSEDDSFRIVE